MLIAGRGEPFGGRLLNLQSAKASSIVHKADGVKRQGPNLCIA